MRIEEARRIGKLQQLGCICCRMRFGKYVEPHIHHITDTGRRMGHEYTIPLCPYHHMGARYSPWGNINKPLRDRLGPARHNDSKREFVATWGDEEYLLEVTNALIEDERNFAGHWPLAFWERYRR